METQCHLQTEGKKITFAGQEQQVYWRYNKMESFVPLQAKSCACPQPEIIANSICEILNQTTPFCTPPKGVFENSNTLALKRQQQYMEQSGGEIISAGCYTE